MSVRILYDSGNIPCSGLNNLRCISMTTVVDPVAGQEDFCVRHSVPGWQFLGDKTLTYHNDSVHMMTCLMSRTACNPAFPMQTHRISPAVHARAQCLPLIITCSCNWPYSPCVPHCSSVIFAVCGKCEEKIHYNRLKPAPAPSIVSVVFPGFF